MLKIMQRSLISASAIAILTAGAGGVPGQVRAANCEDFLDNNSYSCNFVASFGAEFTQVFTFVSPGGYSQHFDLFVEDFGDFPFGCECKARGRASRPESIQFHATKEFHCVLSAEGVVEAAFQISFEGKAVRKGKKIKKGQAVNEFGDSFVYECELLENGIEEASTAAGGGNLFRR